MRAIWRLLLCIVCVGLAPAMARADAASPWLPGPNASGDDTYVGFIDTPLSGANFLPNSTVQVQGWAVDRTAVGWSGIDDVAIYLGLQDQSGTLIVHGTVGVRRADVASALGNAAWANSGFSASFSEASLNAGSNQVTVYLHTPDKGWWYRQLQLNVPAAPDRPFADDPLLIVRTADPSLDVLQSTPQLVLTGYAVDRNMPLSQQLGIAGSGVSTVQAYLDGPRNGGGVGGTLLATAVLGQKNREATGFGQRFLMSGWQLTLYPPGLTIDRHELFLYAESAYWPSETLVVVPFNVN